MEHRIIKLFLLFITIGILTSLRENAGIGKANKSINDEHATCFQAKNGYAIKITCTQAPGVQEKNEATNTAPVVDNEVSLSPIGRFILLQ